MRPEWSAIQERASTLLSEGVFKLKTSPIVADHTLLEGKPCNYLISHHNDVQYIGEAQDQRSRIRIQFNEKRSTFYKNYLRMNRGEYSSISAFHVRVMETFIGRKEIEDFSIVNLATPLNRFQLGKREIVTCADTHAFWDTVQANSTVLVAEGADLCLDTEFQEWHSAEPSPVPGLYMVKSRAGNILYVGESSDVQARYKAHDSTTYFSALRRNLGTELLGYRLQTVKGKKRYFTDQEDASVSNYLHGCRVAFFPVAFGRYEVEEALIRRLQPMLNRKSKTI